MTCRVGRVFEAQRPARWTSKTPAATGDAARTSRGGPCQRRPETRMFVSATARMTGPPFRARGLDLSGYFGLGQGGEVQAGQPVRGGKELLLLAAANGFAEQAFQRFRLQQPNGLRFSRHIFRQRYREFQSRHASCLVIARWEVPPLQLYQVRVAAVKRPWAPHTIRRSRPMGCGKCPRTKDGSVTC